MRQSHLKKLIQQVGEFPTLPSVVGRMLQILDDPYSSATDLTEILSRDQAMTSRILKMANSAYYGFPRAIATVTESIVLLGFGTVRNLILTTTLYNLDQLWERGRGAKSGRPDLFDQRREWKHAVATAVAVRELLVARKQDALEHVGYLAGLMHDIGKQFFYQYFSAEYRAILQGAVNDPDALASGEARQWGADHGQVGAWIVDRWNLPVDIVTPIARHHEPKRAKERKELTWALHDADRVAHHALQDRPSAAEDAEPEGLGPEERGALELKIRQELDEIETFMRVR